LERRYQASTVPLEPGKPFEIKADWWAWGHHVEIATNSDKTPPDAWSAFFKLTKLDGDQTARNVDLDSLSRFEVDNGASNFSINPDMKEPRIKLGDLPVIFVLKRAENDYLGGIELEHFSAPDPRAAIEIALTYFNYLSSFLTLLFQLPLRYSSVTVRAVDDPSWVGYRLYHPWAEAQISAFNVEVPAASIVARLMTQYAEGVFANSRAYQFMCFYKLVDHILTRAGALRTIHDRYPNTPWIELQDTLPEDPIKHFDIDLVGKRYTQARDRYRDTQLRNAVAHVLDNDTFFDPLDPVHASHYSAASIVCRFMAHHLIRIVANNAKMLLERGADAQELLTALYPPKSS